MKTIIVDNDIFSIRLFQLLAEKNEELEIVQTFQNAQEALEYVDMHSVELVVLDTQTETMDGIILGRRLRHSNPDISLIYTTGYDDYAKEVLRLHAAGYLVKPYSEEELRYAVETARLLSKRKKKRIFVRTFGYFDVFVDGKPIVFKSFKAKELLAFLIDRRGGVVTTDQMVSILWEDRPNDEATQNLCSKLVRTLQKELKENQADDMLIVERGSRRVDTDRFECDLYGMLDGSILMRKQYIGEYLLDYSWSEAKTALLDRYLQ